MGNDKFVVSRRGAGLGDRLITLCAAWIYARETGRTLVVDWQGAQYLDTSDNLFPHCFENREHLAGVKLIADRAIQLSGLPPPRYPQPWNNEALIRVPWMYPAEDYPGDRAAAVELIRAGRDIEARTVIFDTCVNDGVVAVEDARQFMAALQPRADLKEAAATFADASLGPDPWIGLHMRHGNGGDVLNHTRYWTLFDHAIERCLEAVAIARNRLGRQAKILLCTDSVEVDQAMRMRLDGLVVRPKQLRPPRTGELHVHPAAAAGLDDAMVEMLLLARCTTLIRYPPGSFFSFYGAVLKPSQAPPRQSVYDLLQGHDPDDPLSPAILF